ncbi:LapA family protein [Hydrogenophaga sp. 5NK40-0174]|uniref:LapA family protein n=1 Tax=Hydrogenophaga sp. 5NK40-0174 TaxID=3127649 RepID=UPI00333F4E4E
MPVKYLMWLLNAALFFVLFAFALNNQQAVTLHLFFGAVWEAPMVLILFAALLVGVVMGAFLMLPLWLRARKRRQSEVSVSHEADAGSSLMPLPPPHHGS